MVKIPEAQFVTELMEGGGVRAGL